MKRLTNNGLLVGCVLLLCFAGTTAADDAGTEKDKAAADSPSDKAKVDDKTHTVKSGPIRVEVAFDGIFEATTMRPAVFNPQQWSELVVEKAVPLGTKVKAGDPLVWLNTTNLDKQIESLEQAAELTDVALHQAQVALAAMEQTAPLQLSSAQRSQKAESEDLAQFLEIERPFAIRSAHEEFKSAQHYLEQAQEELNQLEKMYAEDDLTEETEEIILKRAKQQVESAKFYVESAELDRDHTLKYRIPRMEAAMKQQAAEAEISLQKTKQTVPLSLQQARLDLAKQQIERKQSQQKLTELRKDREGMTLKAPIAGLVYYGDCLHGKWPNLASVTQKLRPGGRLTAREVVITIVSPQPLILRADVPEKELHWLKKGQSGKVESIAQPEAAITGVVSGVSPVPVADGKFDAHIDLGGKGAKQLVPGMKGKFKFVPYARKDALLVPKKAVFTDDWDNDQRNVYVVVNGKHERRNVTVGRTSGDQIEIVKGLAVGDEILLTKPAK